jgi:hypothetical protein
MSRRAWHSVVAAGVIGIVAAATAIILSLNHRSVRHPAHARTATAAATQASQVAAALRKLGSAPQTLVADEAKPQLGSHVRQAIPPGSTTRADEKSWAPDGVGGGTILVKVTGPNGAAVTYAAVMVYEHHGWKVLATIPAHTGR